MFFSARNNIRSNINVNIAISVKNISCRVFRVYRETRLRIVFPVNDLIETYLELHIIVSVAYGKDFMDEL